MEMFIIFLILMIIILVVLVSCVRIVPQANALVVERLGAYLGTWHVGVHFLLPFVDRVAKKVVLKEQVVDFAPQPVITKDNVTMRIDTVVFFQITDPKLFAYGVENPIMAIENLTATTLRNMVIWNWTRPLHPEKPSTPKCGHPWTWPLILGELRSTGWN